MPSCDLSKVDYCSTVEDDRQVKCVVVVVVVVGVVVVVDFLA
jgi:hypothetical protein